MTEGAAGQAIVRWLSVPLFVYLAAIGAAAVLLTVVSLLFRGE